MFCTWTFRYLDSSVLDVSHHTWTFGTREIRPQTFCTRTFRILTFSKLDATTGHFGPGLVTCQRLVMSGLVSGECLGHILWTFRTWTFRTRTVSNWTFRNLTFWTWTHPNTRIFRSWSEVNGVVISKRFAHISKCSHE